MNEISAALTVYNSELVAGGRFTTAGGNVSAYWARWACPPSPPCYPNCDASTGAPLLTGNDFICFITKFAAGESYANCDGSTGMPMLTGNDFQCFIDAYVAGCS
jgi:hypothetical protein